MTNAERILGYLKSIAPREATNEEIVSGSGVRPHQQVFQITQRLLSQGTIAGSKAGGIWRFSVGTDAHGQSDHPRAIGHQEAGTGRAEAARAFQAVAQQEDEGNGGLERAFHREMEGVYIAALEQCGYKASRFRQEVQRMGGLAAAQDLLRKPGISEGLTALWECGRLDLSMEALVLREPWADLFTEEERSIARTRLEQLGHEEL